MENLKAHSMDGDVADTTSADLELGGGQFVYIIQQYINMCNSLFNGFWPCVQISLTLYNHAILRKGRKEGKGEFNCRTVDLAYQNVGYKLEIYGVYTLFDSI